MSDEAVFFSSPEEWRAWLAKNHTNETEIMLGLVKVGSGLIGIGYKQALDEALCYGWIDGVRRTIDDKMWMIRFTPRRPKSHWSAVNLKRFEELETEGRMTEAGRVALSDQHANSGRNYSYESQSAELSAQERRQFNEHPDAWAKFREMPPSYRRAAVWWVVSAKRAETRERRLATLIADSSDGRRIKPLRRPGTE